MPYYPQTNGLAESTKKTLQNILKKIVNQNKTCWDQKWHSALWAYRTTYKMSVQLSLLHSLFKLEAVMPIEFQIPSLRVQMAKRLDEEQSERIWKEKLLELEES